MLYLPKGQCGGNMFFNVVREQAHSWLQNWLKFTCSATVLTLRARLIHLTTIHCCPYEFTSLSPAVSISLNPGLNRSSHQKLSKLIHVHLPLKLYALTRVPICWVWCTNVALPIHGNNFWSISSFDFHLHIAICFKLGCTIYFGTYQLLGHCLHSIAIAV